MNHLAMKRRRKNRSRVDVIGAVAMDRSVTITGQCHDGVETSVSFLSIYIGKRSA